MARRVITIGVYGFDLPTFLEALHFAEVELLIDVRQRRGVRGPRYAWANVTRADLGTLVAELPAGGSAALLCVEADPEACHRSLIAERLAERHGVRISHIRP